jgi:site-specific recombinase XerD
MQGCRALTDDEIDLIKYHFDDVIGDDVNDAYDLQSRNKALFFFGLYSGFRISEILSLTIGDIYDHGHVLDSCYLKRSNTKGKVAGRTGVINSFCKPLLEEYLDHYHLKDKDPKEPLFFSNKGGSLRQRQCQKIYTDLFETLELDGKLSTHTTRKSFAKKIYEAVDRNIVDLQQALGHKNIASTQHYISFDNQKVSNALEHLRF